MAKPLVTFDIRALDRSIKKIDRMLERLGDEGKEALARSVALAAAQVVRDEAIARAPVRDGLLRSAIYVAYSDRRSNDKQFVYSVSWNKRSAPHGHLLELGHWRKNVFVLGKDGTWHPSKRRLQRPKWVPAKPFLRPAYEAKIAEAIEAARARLKERLPEVIAEAKR
ncbi:MAG: HK97 gp10 family phage protein [Rhodocyclaceae bacterium]